MLKRLTICPLSLERIKDYIDIQHEPPSTEEGKPPAAWPTSGELVVENLSARYSQVCKRMLDCILWRLIYLPLDWTDCFT